MTSPSSHCGFPGLNLCLVYTLPGDLDWLPIPLEVEVCYKSQTMKRVYTPRCYGIPEAGGDMVWLSHWLPGWMIFEEGDELEVLFNLKVEGQIKECGVHILYFTEDEMGKYFSTIYHSWDSNMFRVVDLEDSWDSNMLALKDSRDSRMCRVVALEGACGTSSALILIRFNNNMEQVRGDGFWLAITTNVRTWTPHDSFYF